MSPGSSRGVVAILLAGGSGSRFGTEVSKIYLSLAGQPVLCHGLAAFDAAPEVTDVIVVIRTCDRERYEMSTRSSDTQKVRAVVPGGSTRQASEWAGIQAALQCCPDSELALLHDAARPLVKPSLIGQVIAAARSGGGGALPAAPVTDVLVDPGGAYVQAADLIGVQTPQAFPLQVLVRAYRSAMAAGYDGVDTSATVQAFSDLPVTWVNNTRPNPKITHPGDLAMCESLLTP